MSTIVTADSNRKIGSREHNQYVAEGVNEHRETQVAPPSLLLPFDAQLEEQIQNRHKIVKKCLEQQSGKPFFSEAGFLLYHRSSELFLEQLEDTNLRFELTVTSPPYNIGKEYEQPRSVDDYVGWCSQWMDAIHAVTSPHGAFWLNVGYLEVPGKGLCVPIPYLLWEKSQFYLLQDIVWKYGAGVVRGSSHRRAIFHFWG